METVKINIVNFTKGNSLFHHVSRIISKAVIKSAVDSYRVLWKCNVGYETIDLVHKNE